MANTEIRKTVESIEFVIHAQSINIKAIEQVFVDGELFSDRIHRGAYPLENGDIDPELQEKLDFSVRQVLGDALTSAATTNQALVKRLEELSEQVQVKSADIAILLGVNQQKDNDLRLREDFITSLTNEISALKSENAQLKNVPQTQQT